MHRISTNRLVLSCLWLLCVVSLPVQAEEAPTESPNPPYISMNIGVEITGLEQAAEHAAEGLTLIGESLDRLANNHELTPEQNRQVQRALSRVENLGNNLNLAVEQLPNTVEKGFVPVITATNELSSEIKQILVIACVILILIIVAALAAVYYFVLAPATRSIMDTAELLNKLANTLETTAKIVETTGQQNQRVVSDLRQLQQQLQAEPVEKGENIKQRKPDQPTE